MLERLLRNIKSFFKYPIPAVFFTHYKYLSRLLIFGTFAEWNNLGLLIVYDSELHNILCGVYHDLLS
ncbi:MAG: hypothetical protein CMF43_02765 [Legionellales bacterium]|nr:hypothetical protein [Legionellales bacterium]